MTKAELIETLSIELKCSNRIGTLNLNYGERYRQGDRISTGFVESTVNYVVAKRFTKRQQMQWSPKGAHLLLQMRTRVLNGELEQTFRDWHPGFRVGGDEKLKVAA